MSQLSDQEALRQLLLRRTAAKRRAAQKEYLTKTDKATRTSARGILSDLAAEQQFIDAGLLGEALAGPDQKALDVVGRVKTDSGVVPGPYISTNAEGNEVRHYTRAVRNPYTGKVQIVPFMNPETGQPLSTTFGDAKTSTIPGVEYDPRWETPYPPEWAGDKRNMGPQIGDQASELVGKHALWLSGDDSVRSDNSTSIDDFIDPVDGESYDAAKKRRKQVDYTGKAGKIDAQVNPGGDGGPKTRGIRSQTQIYRSLVPNVDEGKGVLKQNILDRMDFGQQGLTSAVTGMKRSGDFSKVIPGKVDKYDQVLTLEFDDALNSENMGYAPNPSLKNSQVDKITMPVERASIVDMHKVQEALNKADSRTMRSKLQIRANSNARYSTPGYKAILELRGGSPAVTDISGRGHTPQILKDIPYEDTGRPRPSTGGLVTPVDTPETVRGVAAPKPGKVNLDGSKPTAARYTAMGRGRSRLAVKPDAPESVTPAVVHTNTDVPSAVVEPEKPVLTQKPARPVTAPVKPEPTPPAPRKPVARPTAPPTRGKPQIVSRATARPNPMARPPRGEGGFVVTPGARSTARTRVAPRVKPGGISGGDFIKGGVIADVVAGGVLSYATGETDNLKDAAWAGATSLIPDSGGTAKTMDIGGKVYTHDEATNMVYDHTGKVQGLAYKDGKPTVVPYGSLKGRTSMIDDVVTPIKQIGGSIKDTAIKRAQEWTKGWFK